MATVQEFPRPSAVHESIERLSRFDGRALEPSDAAPIFVFATGWGTGSTLMQRILLTDSEVMIRGEPFGRMGIIPAWRHAMTALDGSWPKQKVFDRASVDSLWNLPVANLYPEPVSLFSGIRAMLIELFARPASELGFSRWGLKEVRLGLADAILLQKLFPKAKFIALVRDPRSSVLSYKRMNVYWRFDKPISGARAYARHWNRLATEWINAGDVVDHRLLRHEDVVSGGVDFRELEKWLGVGLDERKALGVVTGKRSKKARPNAFVRRIVRQEAGTTMEKLGYGN